MSTRPAAGAVAPATGCRSTTSFRSCSAATRSRPISGYAAKRITGTATRHAASAARTERRASGTGPGRPGRSQLRPFQPRAKRRTTRSESSSRCVISAIGSTFGCRFRRSRPIAPNRAQSDVEAASRSWYHGRWVSSMTAVLRESSLRGAAPVGVLLCVIQLPAEERDTALRTERLRVGPVLPAWIDVEGMPVVASARVSPFAVREAAWLIRRMIGHRKDVLRALATNRVRFAVMAHSLAVFRASETPGRALITTAW